MAASDLIGILLPIAAIQFLGWAAPGPNHLMILSASVTSGRAVGIRVALGIAADSVT
jgi:threonine/homoserine/homoserine lactone efflux protein